MDFTKKWRHSVDDLSRTFLLARRLTHELREFRPLLAVSIFALFSLLAVPLFALDSLLAVPVVALLHELDQCKNARVQWRGGC
jgi:hypothetical protein